MENKLKTHIKKLNDFLFSFDFLKWDNQIENLAKKIVNTSIECGKILICGNGGSAADSQHLAAELVVKFEKVRQPLRAISLNVDTSIITACSNDFNYAHIFSRQIEALGNKNDILISFTTSGNSKNIIEGIKKAKEIDIFTFSFIGKDGGKVKDLSDDYIIVPFNETYLIQEIHQILYHTLVSYIEEIL